MGRPRRQQANYAAEWRLADRLQQASPLGRRYLSARNVTLTDARAYLHAVQAEPWFRAAWPNELRPITVESAKGSSSHTDRLFRTIALNPEHRRTRPYAELVILHELAHLITKKPHENRPRRELDESLSRGHTKPWRDHFARLVGATFGPRWARRLRDEMDREPSLCTCDGRHVSPACREFGAHPELADNAPIPASTETPAPAPAKVVMLRHKTPAGRLVKLKPYQAVGAAFAVGRGRSIIADDMGVGKTWEALSALETAMTYPAVVVCPKQAIGNWKREIAACLPHRDDDDWIKVINYDVLHARGFKDFFGDEPQGLVVDELHYVKEGDARRTQAVKDLAARISADGLIIMMSGTPFVNRPKELVEPLLMLGYLSSDPLAPDSAEAFKWRFCAKYQRKMVTVTNKDGEEEERERLVTTFDGARNAEELGRWLRRKCLIRRRKAEVLAELGTKTRRQVLVKISDDDYARYRELAAKAAEQADHAKALVELGKLRQLTGKAKVQQTVPWIREFCESGRKLVVFAEHIDVQQAILAALRRAGIASAELLGDTANVEASKARFQEGDAQVIVCSMKAANISHTLTAASDVLIVEYGYTPAEHDQAEDRVHRIGQTRPVTAHYLSAAGTLDEWSFKLIERKRAVFDKVLNTTGAESAAELESIEDELMTMLREEYGTARE